MHPQVHKLIWRPEQKNPQISWYRREYLSEMPTTTDVFSFFEFQLGFLAWQKKWQEICAGHADVRFHRHHVALGRRSRGSEQSTQNKICKKIRKEKNG